MTNLGLSLRVVNRVCMSSKLEQAISLVIRKYHMGIMHDGVFKTEVSGTLWGEERWGVHTQMILRLAPTFLLYYRR